MVKTKGSRQRLQQREGREDPVQFPTDDQRAIVLDACEHAARAGNLDDVKGFATALAPERLAAGEDPLSVIAAGLPTIRIAGFLPAGESAPAKWLLSFFWWYEWQRRGEPAAFEALPILFHLDCAFFLQRRWIAEILAQWRARVEADKIAHVFFFGIDKRRGVRSFELLQKIEARDLKVCAEIERLRGQDVSITDAVASVAWESDTLIGEKLSPRNVRKIYEQRREGHSGLESRLIAALETLTPKSGSY